MFKTTLDKHLQAVTTKNIDGFLETVSKEDITLIMPNGSLINDCRAFSDLHKSWFLDDDWSIEYKIIEVKEGKHLSSALLEINYHDLDENNQSIHLHYYLYLLFEKKDHEWLLIHDQNTIIK